MLVPNAVVEARTYRSLDAYSLGHHAPDQVARVLMTLDCCNRQRGQLYALTKKEAPAHRTTRNKWAAGAAIIGFATLAVICWPLIVAAPLVSGTAATAIGVTGVTGSIATAKCIEKAYHSHLDSKGMTRLGPQRSSANRISVQDVVHKIGDTMLSLRTFLYIAQWRSHGLEDDDDMLIGFAESMAEMFNTRNVMDNWNDPVYKEQYVRSDWTSMRRDIHEFMTRVRSRRQPHETDTGGGNHAIIRLIWPIISIMTIRLVFLPSTTSICRTLNTLPSKGRTILRLIQIHSP